MPRGPPEDGLVEDLAGDFFDSGLDAFLHHLAQAGGGPHLHGEGRHLEDRVKNLGRGGAVALRLAEVDRERRPVAVVEFRSSERKGATSCSGWAPSSCPR